MDEEITLTKSELLEFLGAVALPPFDGHPEADHWDCAPLASNLSDAVEVLFQDKKGGPLFSPDKEKV